MAFMAICVTLEGNFMSQNYKSYGIAINKDDEFLTVIGTIGSIFNSLSRFFWGTLIDYFPFKYLIITNFTI